LEVGLIMAGMGLTVWLAVVWLQWAVPMIVLGRGERWLRTISAAAWFGVAAGLSLVIG
jgi:hypothetical protein